jgi:hypothetical protein
VGLLARTGVIGDENHQTNRRLPWDAEHIVADELELASVDCVRKPPGPPTHNATQAEYVRLSGVGLAPDLEIFRHRYACTTCA